MHSVRPDQGARAGSETPRAPDPGARPDRAAGARMLIGSLAGGFVAAFVVSAALLLVTDSMIVLGLAAEAGFFLGVVAFLAASRRPPLRVLRAGPQPTRVYWLAFLLGLALLAANFVTTLLLGPSPRDVEMLGQVEGFLERAVLAIGVALVAPIVEEALFRGLLQGVLERWTSEWLAIFGAGLAFALMHAPGPGPLFFFLWSIPVGWVTWKTGSIRPAIVVHMVNNLAGVVAFLAASPDELEEVPPTTLPIALLIAVLLLAAAGAVSLSRIIAARSRETPAMEGS